MFSREEREASHQLYAWCRHCDDVIDDAPSIDAARLALTSLERDTLLALEGRAPQHPAFLGLEKFVKRYQVPFSYPLDLLRGMQMDIEGTHYQTLSQLELYCYRVASVVGLMMVHAMGVSSPEALKHAIDTGLAMQMTNIARDVREDFEMGRVYLPTEWFNEFAPDKRAWPAVARLLEEAEKRYASGEEGLKYLPLRAALAVSAAQTIYREIGRKILARGPEALKSRMVVSLPRKLVLLTQAFTKVLPIAARRLVSPWRRALLPVYEHPIELPQFKQR